MGCGLQVGNGRSPDGSRAPPLKSRSTWSGDEIPGSDPNRQRITRRRTVGQHLESGRDGSPEPGKLSFLHTDCLYTHYTHILSNYTPAKTGGGGGKG